MLRNSIFTPREKKISGYRPEGEIGIRGRENKESSIGLGDEIFKVKKEKKSVRVFLDKMKARIWRQYSPRFGD